MSSSFNLPGWWRGLPQAVHLSLHDANLLLQTLLGIDGRQPLGSAMAALSSSDTSGPACRTSIASPPQPSPLSPQYCHGL
ncbi:hypothetical protein QYE76_065678 [Lolium multiflorum]|uniref:Uncharacterized protein n=1 Tax=Lolium multiflorum TaxID=4521 RepID=A0AAD8SA45_LOLMU|nr:hypothetical protein QYE76_065678 [Lolium multiflorum]